MFVWWLTQVNHDQYLEAEQWLACISMVWRKANWCGYAIICLKAISSRSISEFRVTLHCKQLILFYSSGRFFEISYTISRLSKDVATNVRWSPIDTELPSTIIWASLTVTIVLCKLTSSTVDTIDTDYGAQCPALLDTWCINLRCAFRLWLFRTNA